MKDINVSITPRDASGALVTKRATNADSKGNLPIKVREPLESQQGTFFYETEDLDGTLEVCVQSYTASMDNPSRVALTIAPATENDDIQQELESERQLLNEKLESENKVIKQETSRISAELMRMHRRAKSIAGDAQFSKKREEDFHGKSISLNKAVKFWPMVRMIVVMIGGYMQVSHVIAYMKSRHIY